MHFLKKFFRVTALCSLALTIVTMSTVAFFNTVIPDSFNVVRGDTLTFPNAEKITGSNAVGFENASAVNVGITPNELCLKLFNIIPIKTTQINQVDRASITPGGTPFGIKLFTRGVMVIGANNVETSSGVKNPSQLAGIVKGDVLLSMNSIELTTNEQVSQIIENSNGEHILLTLERNGKMIKTILTPLVSAIDGKYKGGIWVRDSSAGIGTITYFDDDLFFGGLGHGICDVDTGKIMPLNSGQVCAVTINSVKKGKAGTPGELKGGFSGSDPNGVLFENNEAGIFGTLNDEPNNFSPIDIMLKQEVRHGKAKIICTLDNKGPKEYDIVIEKIDLNPRSVTKNLVISVTDKRLLEISGGIVQGMSGSPIIQNGKLVGAVTHVFVNNPQKGYGIFIENMLDKAN